MKTLFVSALVICLSLLANAASANSYSNTDSELKQAQLDQKLKQEEKKKPTKYDFSLFKFIAPTKVQEKDSTDQKIEPEKKILKDETVYENPRAFFRFSYAS